MLSSSSCCLSNCCSLCRRCAKRKRFYCLPWISLEQVSWHPRAVSSIAVPSLPLGMDAASARGDVHLLNRTRVRIRIRPRPRPRPRHRNSHRNLSKPSSSSSTSEPSATWNRSRGTPGCGIVRDRARPVRARVGLHLASSARRSAGGGFMPSIFIGRLSCASPHFSCCGDHLSWPRETKVD